MAGENKMPPLIGKEYQPDAGSSFEPGDIYNEMAKKRETAEEEKNRRDNGQLPAGEVSREQQPNIAAQMSAEKQKKKIPTEEEKAAEAAAIAATALPVAGGIIKIVAFLIRGLKATTGEQIASFLAVWLLLGILLAFLNILPIIGTIFFIIIPPCAALVITPIIWPHLKPFVEQAGKIIPTKK